MNGFRVHKQVTGTYSAGTDDQLVANGAYRLVSWATLQFGKGWELDATNMAVYCRTPGIKMFSGHLWANSGLTSGGENTIKITQNGTLLNLTTITGTDVAASIAYPNSAGGWVNRGGLPFGGVVDASAGDFFRVWYWGAGAGNINLEGNRAHSYFQCVDNGGGYGY